MNKEIQKELRRRRMAQVVQIAPDSKFSEEEITHLREQLEANWEVTYLNDEMCSICHLEFENQNQVIVLRSCSHVYHSTCLIHWLKLSCKCPMCKINIKLELLE